MTLRSAIVELLFVASIGQTSEQIYNQAVAAIQANDCATAVPLLRKYLLMEKDALKQNPQARIQIENQISECTAWVIKGSPL